MQIQIQKQVKTCNKKKEYTGTNCLTAQIWKRIGFKYKSRKRTCLLNHFRFSECFHQTHKSTICQIKVCTCTILPQISQGRRKLCDCNFKPSIQRHNCWSAHAQCLWPTQPPFPCTHFQCWSRMPYCPTHRPGTPSFSDLHVLCNTNF